MKNARAPLGVIGRFARNARTSVTNSQTTTRKKARSRHMILALVIVTALQGVAAGPAAVATLPTEFKQAKITPDNVVGETALAKTPWLFASILDTAFPFPTLANLPQPSTPQPVKPSIERVSSVDQWEILDRPYESMSFGSRTVPRWLVGTILKAAYLAGVDPVYLMTLADVESSLSPGAKAPTSSAEGLFQFIDRTWLETLHEHAGAYGYDAVANAISIVDDDPVITDAKDRAWIMGLRRDPYFSALMACELIKDIQRELQAVGERELAEAELYLAHFLGASNAVRFLQALDEEPNTPAAKLFPKAAKANAGLFMKRSGRRRRPVTVAEFYDRIDSKIVPRLNRYEELPLVVKTAHTADRSVEATATMR